MTEADLEGVTAAVRADRAFVRLLNALALGEGFQFNILVCETPRLAQAAIRALVEELSALRGDPMALVLLDPYEGIESLNEPISFERLTSHILERCSTRRRARTPRPRFS